jgi:hypothetical protein
MKKLSLILTLIFGGLLMFSTGAYAENLSEIPGASVYSAKSEQEAIYEAIQKSDSFMKQLEHNGIRVVKESITPVYKADFLEYAKTSNFEIKLSNEFYVKAVTSEGLFAGNFLFSVENGVAETLMFTPSIHLEQYFFSEYGFEGNEFLVSRNYADHAKRIQELTKRDSFVPVSEIRYVNINSLGEVFYINDGKTESLVFINADSRIFHENIGEIVYINDELKKMAVERLAEHQASLAEIEEWKKANPGEEYLVDGGGDNVPLFGVDNNKIDGNSMESANVDENTPKSGNIIAIIAIITILTISAALLLLKLKKA